MTDRKRDDLKDFLTGEFDGLPRVPGDWLSGPLNIPPKPVDLQPETGRALVTEKSHEYVVKKRNAENH